MRLPPSAAFKAAQHGVAVLASCLVLLSPPTPHLAPCASAAPPTEEAQVNLKKGFNAAQLGLTSADALLSASIDEWERTNQPADETAAIYKTRGMVREQNNQLPAARAGCTGYTWHDAHQKAPYTELCRPLNNINMAECKRVECTWVYADAWGHAGASSSGSVLPGVSIFASSLTVSRTIVT